MLQLLCPKISWKVGKNKWLFLQYKAEPETLSDQICSCH